jgi:hypothetical protein
MQNYLRAKSALALQAFVTSGKTWVDNEGLDEILDSADHDGSTSAAQILATDERSESHVVRIDTKHGSESLLPSRVRRILFEDHETADSCAKSSIVSDDDLLLDARPTVAMSGLHDTSFEDPLIDSGTSNR